MVGTGVEIEFSLEDGRGRQPEPCFGGVGALELALLDACRGGRLALRVSCAGGGVVELSKPWMARLARAAMAHEWESREESMARAASGAAKEAWPILEALAERASIVEASGAAPRGRARRI